MTPEQRARFLYTDMFSITVDDYCAKQCALRAVDEILKTKSSGIEFFYYWEKVKHEIEQL